MADRAHDPWTRFWMELLMAFLESDGERAEPVARPVYIDNAACSARLLMSGVPTDADADRECIRPVSELGELRSQVQGPDTFSALSRSAAFLQPKRAELPNIPAAKSQARWSSPVEQGATH